MASGVIGLDPARDSGWLLRIDGALVTRLRHRYVESGQLSNPEWEEIVDTAARALSQCPDPAQQAGAVTGLAIGKVQSGKTLSYSTLIALAIDNGYRIGLVLAGTKKPLLQQTYERLVYDLDPRRHNLTPFMNPRRSDVNVLRGVLHGGGSALMVILKQVDRLETAAGMLSSAEFRSQPILIIDDEGDEASLNTQFRRGEASATYARILQLRSHLSLHAYVAYTATPQANLLVSGLDALAPDFAVLVQPGDGYCGGEIFFGQGSDAYLRRIPVDQADPVRAHRVTSALVSSLASFYAGAAVRWLRGDTRPHSMLIHTSNLQADHARLHRSIAAHVELWRTVLSLPDQDPGKQGLLTILENAYEDLSRTVEAIPSWAAVIDRIQEEVWLTETWMVNSLPLGQDPIRTPFRLRNNILVGGNMLGRGLTIDGLAVTYISREAQRNTNADTLEQRARWFGYKSAYLDVCRIYLPIRLEERYSELLRHEDDFWEALRRNERQGIPVHDWPRMFRLDMATWQLRPTRPSVAAFKQFRGQEWDVQQHVEMDQERAARNIDVVRGFFLANPGQPLRYGNTEHTILSDFRAEALIAELLARLDLDETLWSKAYAEEYLIRLVMSGRSETIDLLLMAGGSFRERTMRGNGTVNPMQGRTPGRGPGDPAFYPGDQHIHGDRPQFQVHLLRVRPQSNAESTETTALAMFIPTDPRFDLRVVVRAQ